MSTETKTLTNADAKIQPKLGVKALVQIGMLSAIAVVLMMFDIPLPFAPTFYKIDLSEVPVLVGCFAMGPMAGVLVELVKILLNLVLQEHKHQVLERLQTLLSDVHSVYLQASFTEETEQERVH